MKQFKSDPELLAMQEINVMPELNPPSNETPVLAGISWNEEAAAHCSMAARALCNAASTSRHPRASVVKVLREANMSKSRQGVQI